MWTWCLREIIVGCGLALLVGGGYWQGRMIGRWQPLSSAAAVEFEDMPREFAGWSSVDIGLNPEETQAAGIDRYLAREYTHQGTGETFTVLILSGAGGPISVHPPDVCFAGRGYLNDGIVPTKMADPAGGPEHQFSMAIFRGPESSAGHRVQLFWAWSDSGIWTTPSNPRLAFARLPRLYKIYVSRNLLPDQGRQDIQECLDFMQLVLPQFEQLLNGGQPASEPQAGSVGQRGDGASTEACRPVASSSESGRSGRVAADRTIARRSSFHG